MKHNHRTKDVSIYLSNFRAEDGAPHSRWNALCEGVVIPLASLFAVFLFVVGAMLIAD